MMILQSNPGWLNARIGHLTGSRMGDAMNVQKNGKPGAARDRLLKDIVAERLTNVATHHFVTPAMAWGIGFEPQAISEYEALTGNIVYPPAAFVTHPDIEYFGASSDGLIGDDAVLEVKCPTTQTFISWMQGAEAPRDHWPQMTAQLLCTGRSVVHFFAYDPRMPPGKRHILRHFTPSQEYRDRVRLEAVRFLTDVERMFDIIINEG